MRGRNNSVILDRISFGFNPIREGLSTLGKRTIFSTSALVTGQIISCGVKIAGVRQSWGYNQAKKGQEFEVPVEAKYFADGPKHTRMDLKIWRPDGSSFTAKDDDFWPYASPSTQINFFISGFAGEAFNINQEGNWYGELTYVWVT